MSFYSLPSVDFSTVFSGLSNSCSPQSHFFVVFSGAKSPSVASKVRSLPPSSSNYRSTTERTSQRSFVSHSDRSSSYRSSADSSALASFSRRIRTLQTKGRRLPSYSFKSRRKIMYDIEREFDDYLDSLSDDANDMHDALTAMSATFHDALRYSQRHNDQRNTNKFTSLCQQVDFQRDQVANMLKGLSTDRTWQLSYMSKHVDSGLDVLSKLESRLTETRSAITDCLSDANRAVRYYCNRQVGEPRREKWSRFSQSDDSTNNRNHDSTASRTSITRPSTAVTSTAPTTTSRRLTRSERSRLTEYDDMTRSVIDARDRLSVMSKTIHKAHDRIQISYSKNKDEYAAGYSQVDTQLSNLESLVGRLSQKSFESSFATSSAFANNERGTVKDALRRAENVVSDWEWAERRAEGPWFRTR